MSFINKIRLTALFVIFAISLSCFTAQSQQLSNRKQGTVLEQLEQNSRNNLIDQVINYAYRFRGTPYRYGAMSPRGFDCSGFTSYVFKRFGIELDRSSRGQIFDSVRVKKNDLQPGDLVFFQNTYTTGISHVGIYIGNGDFIHASSSKGVMISSLSNSYWSSRYYGARRVL
jgi:cell wall-associated NlpC family hydrolase